MCIYIFMCMCALQFSGKSSPYLRCGKLTKQDVQSRVLSAHDTLQSILESICGVMKDMCHEEEVFCLAFPLLTFTRHMY